jgi:hypothetical protein
MSTSVGVDIGFGNFTRPEMVGANTIYVRNNRFISENLDADIYFYLQTKVMVIIQNNLQYIIDDELAVYKREEDER